MPNNIFTRYNQAHYDADVYSVVYPFPVRLQVLANGVDITSSVNMGIQDLQVDNVLTQQVDTCSFYVTNYQLLTLKEWDEVIITDLNTSLKFFGGFVQRIDKIAVSTRLDAVIHCSDYTCRLDHTYVKTQYTSPVTDAYVLNDVFTRFLPEINATDFVDTLRTYPKLRFNRLTLREVVDQLSTGAGGDWYVDYDKKLHYFLTEADVAPFGLSDTPNNTTLYPYSDLKVNREGTGIINRVEVVGGNYLSDDTTIYVAGTGQDQRISIPFSMSAGTGQTGVLMWRNDGTVGVPIWTPLTVKIGYIQELAGANDVLYYYNEKVIEQQAVWPNLANAVKLFGKLSIPLQTRYSDFVSYTFYNNRYFDAVINDQSITDKVTAQQLAQGLMARASLSATQVSCKILQPGVVSGQTIYLTNVIHSLANSPFTVQRVVTRVKTGGFIEADLTLGVWRPELTDIIIQLARNAKTPPIWRDDEVLQELLQEPESITFTGETKTLKRTVTPPTRDNYKWEWLPYTAFTGLTWDSSTWGT